jgi:hypothetical protein
MSESPRHGRPATHARVPKLSEPSPKALDLYLSEIPQMLKDAAFNVEQMQQCYQAWIRGADPTVYDLSPLKVTSGSNSSQGSGFTEEQKECLNQIELLVQSFEKEFSAAAPTSLHKVLCRQLLNLMQATLNATKENLLESHHGDLKWAYLTVANGTLLRGRNESGLLSRIRETASMWTDDESLVTKLTLT